MPVPDVHSPNRVLKFVGGGTSANGTAAYARAASGAPSAASTAPRLTVPALPRNVRRSAKYSAIDRVTLNLGFFILLPFAFLLFWVILPSHRFEGRGDTPHGRAMMTVSVRSRRKGRRRSRTPTALVARTAKPQPGLR